MGIKRDKAGNTVLNTKIMKILVQGLYYKLTRQKKKLSPLFTFSDGASYQEWIDEDNYIERVRELQFELGILKKPKKLEEVEFIWCVVGNIVEEHELGVGKELKKGTKHFSPGTKVFCFPPLWGDGYENIIIIGRPRKSNRFVKIVMKSDLIENWRVKKVYNPYVKSQMLKDNGWDDTQESRAKATEIVAKINNLNKKH